MPQTSIEDIRLKYPQYDDLSDQQLADGLHAKFYSDLPKEQFYSQIGLAVEAPQPKERGNAASRFFEDYTDDESFPGLAGHVVRGAAGIAQSAFEDPVNFLVQPFTAPQRAVSGTIAASEELALGNYGKAGSEALGAATAAGETALLAVPGGRALAAPRQSTRNAVLQDFARVGIDPTLPAVAPKIVGPIAKPISENYFGGATIRQGADKVSEQSAKATQRTANAYSSAGYVDAGTSAQRGVQGQLRKRKASQRPANPQFQTFREKAETVYDDAFSNVNTTAKVDPQATRQALAEVNTRFSNPDLADLFRLPKNARLQEILEGSGEVSIADLRALRTAIREAQDQGQLIKTVDEAALERLEGTLTDDIFNGIRATSGAGAERKLRVADRFYRQNITSIKEALKPFIKDGDPPEKAFAAIERAALGNSKGDIRQLRALRRSLTPQQMDDVSAALIRKMGQAKEGGDFSVETFTNNWNKMSEPAKATMFDRAQRPELRQNLDALARVLERQARVEALSNKSRSGVSLQTVATGAALLNPGTSAVVIAGIVGANAFGRLLMSPSFTRALYSLELRAPRLTTAEAKKAAILSAIATAEASDEAIKPYLAEIRSALEASNDNLSQEATGPTQTGQ